MRALWILLALAIAGCDGGDTDDPDADSDGDGWVDSEDCAPEDDTVHPDAEEVCDGVDNDCDGEVDVGATDAPTFYADADGDTFGADGSSVEACEAPGGHVADGGDCDDTRDDVYPGADEICDGVDNDCDALVDDEDDPIVGGSTWYPDADGDGYGVDAGVFEACDPPSGSSEVGGDCNDEDAHAHPDAFERCNGLDDDCDGDASDTGAVSVGDVGFRDIQQALNAAAGGVVLLCDGTYTGSSSASQPATLRSLNGPEVTLLDGRGSTRLLTVRDVHLTVEGITLMNGVGSSGSTGTGGAIDASQYGGDVTLDGCVLSGNEGAAGAVRMGTGTLVVSDTTFSDNAASGSGGAISSAGPVAVSGSTFTGNSARGDGGAIHVESTGTLDLSESSVSEGSAVNGAGVAAAGAVTVTDTEIFDNSATSYGGGLYVEGDLDLAGTTEISTNVATQGGGVYVESCDVTMEDTVLLESNRALSSGRGGGVFVNASGGASASWTGGSITDNVSDSLGGGMQVEADEASGSSASIDGVYAEGNEGDWSGGGFWFGGPVEVVDCTAVDNTSTYGGGMSVNESTSGILLDTVTITGNYASDGGGAFDVYLTPSTIVDSVIESNESELGGAVYIPAEAWLTSDDSDWGEDTTDNSPDDVYFEESGESWDFGAGESFHCDGDTATCT